MLFNVLVSCVTHEQRPSIRFLGESIVLRGPFGKHYLTRTLLSPCLSAKQRKVWTAPCPTARRSGVHTVVRCAPLSQLIQELARAQAGVARVVARDHRQAGRAAGRRASRPGWQVRPTHAPPLQNRPPRNSRPR